LSFSSSYDSDDLGVCDLSFKVGLEVETIELFVFGVVGIVDSEFELLVFKLVVFEFVVRELSVSD
jgi:hypothetical protein